MTTINHWGKWVCSDDPVTGVINTNAIAWEFVSDEICLTCMDIEAEIQAEFDAEEHDEDDLDEPNFDMIECDSSHTRIFGDWLVDDKGKYYADPNGEFAAIENELYTQVVFSKTTKRCNLCSLCFPGQGDLGSVGEFLTYCLPDYLTER